MSLPPDVRTLLESHLGHAAPGTPFDILSAHLASLPPGLARAVGSAIPARERTRIAPIRRRRHLHAHGTPRPEFLGAEAARVRWPLLWERLGGDPRAADTAAQAEERAWAENTFTGERGMVGRIGRMMAEEEEVREWMEARDARARERRLDTQGEEFDDSDDEGQPDGPGAAASRFNAGTGDSDQEAVVRAFERQVLELFLDGLDTIDYDDIDFTEPPPDPVAEREAEEAWFDDEEPSAAGPGVGVGNGTRAGASGAGAASRPLANGASRANGQPRANGTRFESQNGQGEYDY